ncbi:MAG TPA: uracil-DNA glycosylase [Pseudomonadota bacterium]|nr:uracil-DNA glycosylase [Pseudomonadota bacterium]
MEATGEAASGATNAGSGTEAAVHAAPADGLSAESELLQLARATRQQLERLRDAGVSGVPRAKVSSRRAAPEASPARASAPPARPAPPPTHAPSAPFEPGAAPPVPPAIAEHRAPAVRPTSPAAPPAGAAGGSPGPSRSLSLVEVNYAELPPPGALRGREGLLELSRLLGDCQRCKLCHGRNHIVFADGSPEAVLAFVGEGPGADEDRLGRPFVGAAGQLLDKMIDAMGAEARKRGYADLSARLSRQAVYIANVVKCRPPGNRTPELDEMAACSPFLRRQLLALRPGLRAIVALGRTPTQYLLRSTAPISGLRGQFAAWEGIPVMPTYHPAYLLRTPSAKRQVWEDLQKVIEALGRPGSPSAAGAARSPDGEVSPASPQP